MKVYKSKPPYLIIVILPISMIVAELIYRIQLSLLFVTINILVLYIIYYFIWFRFEIHEKYMIQRYIFRPFCSIKKISYDKIYLIEVRNNLKSRDRSIIFHFNKEDEKSMFYFNRSFTYGNGKSVEFFISALKEKGIPIKINIDKEEYKKDWVRFNKLLNSSSDLQNSQ
jgi:hypothetical protein